MLRKHLFDSGSTAINKGTLDPLQNHSFDDIGNVQNKAGNLPVTTEEFCNNLIKRYVILTI